MSVSAIELDELKHENGAVYQMLNFLQRFLPPSSGNPRLNDVWSTIVFADDKPFNFRSHGSN